MAAPGVDACASAAYPQWACSNEWLCHTNDDENMHRLNTGPVSVDVAIVGGGVAGSSLTIALVEGGLKVALIEREARFRDRVRGESLHPWGHAEAARLGLVPCLVDAGANPLPVWQRYRDRFPEPPYHWSEDVPEDHVEWGISHPALQETLLQRAGAVGATVLRPAAVVRCRWAPTLEITVAGHDSIDTVRARLLVGADGAHSLVRRWIGGTVKHDPTHHLIGGGLLDGVDLDATAAHQGYFPGGMVMIMPRQYGTARAYYVCDPDRAAVVRAGGSAGFLAACASALPEGALSAATPAGPVAFFPGADSWSGRLSGDDTVLIGDAAGANDPSQGHGLSLAFRDARSLRDCLCSTAPSGWPAAIADFAADREQVFAVLRAHAQWAGQLLIDQGSAADERRERAGQGREVDPTAGGFAGIYAFGPDGLVVDETARRHFFGEDLELSGAA